MGGKQGDWGVVWFGCVCSWVVLGRLCSICSCVRPGFRLPADRAASVGPPD